MQEILNQLKSILAEVYDLYNAAALLSWDQQTYMPPRGTLDRGFQIGTIEKIAHIKFTSDQVGELLDRLVPFQEQLDPDSNDARLIEVARRDYLKETKVPSEWVEEFARQTTNGTQLWQEARAENNFPKFQPILESIFNLRRQYSGFFEPYDHIYDPILDDFEPGLKTAEVIEIFSTIRPKQVALIKAITAKQQVDDPLFNQTFDVQKQWDFGVEVLTSFGYDWDRGRQDKSAHPFTQSVSLDDVRITTRFSDKELNPGLFASMHEAGHALYEQGIDHELRRTLLANGTSLAVHESQSRMFENLVGRSIPFWDYFYPRLQEVFPSQLSDVSQGSFYKAINKVEPSLIRVEADEATYNLHIMLRLELEIALMEGSLEVSDLPAAWNEKMSEFLGLIPPDDADGVLQDVHWSSGLIGYFSTYALGNLISAQIWEVINRDIPDLPQQIRKGEFGELLAWLRNKIHHHGRKFEPQELVQRVTGSKIDPNPYLNYLENKFGEIYNL